MILGPVLLVDCAVFLLFLAPQLLINVGFWDTLVCALKALPFLLLELPFSFIHDRYITRSEQQIPFVQQATIFEDSVVRCIRYAFANIPANIGRVFLSKEVALPFIRFRMLRHGYIKFPVHWEEISENNMRGIWIIQDPTAKPDIVIYYAHGGGFSMGSPHFYLEFLLSLHHHLLPTFTNPAILALNYTLTPTAHHPTQLHEALSGYNYLLTHHHLPPAKICLAGDSAGATIMLSLLLHISQSPSAPKPKPGMITLISPWITLTSPLHKNTPSDYLNTTTLSHYSTLYAPCQTSFPHSSPGQASIATWTAASPSKWLIIYGSSEVFAPSIREFIDGTLRKIQKVKKVELEVVEEEAGIHAWVFAALFLCETDEKRFRGVRRIAQSVGESMG